MPRMKDGFEVDKLGLIPEAICQSDLHSHKKQHEIILYLEGDSRYYIEGNIYNLSPGDLVLAANDELHRVIHNSPKFYARYLIFIDIDFFAKNNCEDLAAAFENKLPGYGNFYSSDYVKSSGIINTVERLYKYCIEGEETVAKGALFELLYLLKKAVNVQEKPKYASIHIQNIIVYIKENLSGDLSLETLSKHFNLNAAYMSRLFKKHLKISIKKYVTYKRLLYARQLRRQGKTLLSASIEAGFVNYSTFYKEYVREFGKKPRDDSWSDAAAVSTE
ncbi:MAG: helix-turn-helix domain-containing protein [Clostridia bacterium]|nr:helix-turn-helix domain-containing protein [Clostridia bacterium]